jgi:hypothetical protein
MPLVNLLFLCLVIISFVAFAGTLAWGDAQCRVARRRSTMRPAKLRDKM